MKSANVIAMCDATYMAKHMVIRVSLRDCLKSCNHGKDGNANKEETAMLGRKIKCLSHKYNCTEGAINFISRNDRKLIW